MIDSTTAKSWNEQSIVIILMIIRVRKQSRARHIATNCMMHQLLLTLNLTMLYSLWYLFKFTSIIFHSYGTMKTRRYILIIRLGEVETLSRTLINKLVSTQRAKRIHYNGMKKKVRVKEGKGGWTDGRTERDIRMACAWRICRCVEEHDRLLVVNYRLYLVLPSSTAPSLSAPDRYTRDRH